MRPRCAGRSALRATSEIKVTVLYLVRAAHRSVAAYYLRNLPGRYFPHCIPVMLKLPVVPVCRAFACLSCRANHNDDLGHPASMKRGVSADRHERGGGERWTQDARETNARIADGEVVGSWRSGASANAR